MKKFLALFLAILMVLSVFSACGAAKTDAPAAADDGTMEITVYSPAASDPLNGGLEAFAKAYPNIKVNVVSAGTGELLKRIEAEANAPLCDVFWGGGAESMEAYAQYFDTYVSEWDSVIPESLKNSNDLWVGESPVPVVIMYNKKLLAELGVDIPTGWGDLINPKLKGMVAYANPSKSGSAYTLLCTMITAMGGPEGGGWDFIADLYEILDGKIQDSSSAAYKLVADGEYAIGLTQEKTAQEYVDAGDTNVGYIFPKEGTSAVPDAIAIIKGAPNPEGAKIFAEFILSREAQEMQAENFNRRPIRTDAKGPGNLCDLSEIKLVDYDFQWAALEKAEIIEKFQEIVTG